MACINELSILIKSFTLFLHVLFRSLAFYFTTNFTKNSKLARKKNAKKVIKKKKIDKNFVCFKKKCYLCGRITLEKSKLRISLVLVIRL